MVSINSLSLRVLTLAVALLTISALAMAQDAPEHRFTANFGGGYTMTTGKISQRLDNGWNVSGGAGINLSNWFSIGPQFTYSVLGASNTLLNLVQAPGGTAHVWSITLDPRLQFGTSSRFAPYIVGGIGYYRRTVNFTQPGLVPVTFLDPFFGFFNSLVPTDLVIGSNSRGGIGGNLGGGLSFGIGNRAGGARIFAEARYHYANTGSLPTRMIPITFGIRF